MNPIAVIPKSSKCVFWNAVEAGAREGAKEAGVKMIWNGPVNEIDDDVAQQIQIVQQFVSEGVGGIVLAPIDDIALRDPVAAAMQKGIPVVIMDSALKGEPPKDLSARYRPTTAALEKWLASSWGSFYTAKARWCSFAI